LDVDKDIWSYNMSHLPDCVKWFCLLKILFSFNQVIIKIDTYEIDWIKSEEKHIMKGYTY